MDDFSISVICKPSILQAEYGGDRYFKTNQCLIVVIHYFFSVISSKLGRGKLIKKF